MWFSTWQIFIIVTRITQKCFGINILFLFESRGRRDNKALSLNSRLALAGLAAQRAPLLHSGIKIMSKRNSQPHLTPEGAPRFPRAGL